MNRLVNDKERIKTLLIVVLFITTILLLYFLWDDHVSLDKNVATPAASGQEYDIQHFIKPAEVIVNFGGNSYTVITDQTESYLEKFIKEFINYSESDNIDDIFVKQISQEQWNEAMGCRSIQYKFDYAMPFTQVVEAIGVAKMPSFNSIDTVSIIGYSTIKGGEGIFIYNGKNKYFWLFSDSKPQGINDIITNIEESGYEQYYPMKSFTGVDNTALLSIYKNDDIKKLKYKQEIKSTDEEKTNQLAETFFGESFDFIRKIVEKDGTMIYMYGYGQKMLILSPTGSLEYREDPDSESNVQLGFIDSMEKAVEFIALHGSMNSQNGTNIYPYLKNVKTIEKGKGYEFIFGYMVNGCPVYYSKEDPIVVDVIGSQVVKYKRYIFDLDQDNNDEITMSDETATDIFPILDALTKNCKKMSKILSNNTTVKDEDAIFTSVSLQIKDVRIGYYIQNQSVNKEKVFQPVWIVYTGKVNFFFDLKTGDLIGYSQNK